MDQNGTEGNVFSLRGDKWWVWRACPAGKRMVSRANFRRRQENLVSRARVEEATLMRKSPHSYEAEGWGMSRHKQKYRQAGKDKVKRG